VIAERKSFLSKKKLVYIAKYRIDEEKREVRFMEMIKETSSGLSGGWDSGLSPGFGFRKETFRTGRGTYERSVEELSSLFGKQYSFKFDFSSIRGAIEGLARQAGFAFRYQITPMGL